MKNRHQAYLMHLQVEIVGRPEATIASDAGSNIMVKLDCELNVALMYIQQTSGLQATSGANLPASG